jgi:hypothetical protein
MSKVSDLLPELGKILAHDLITFLRRVRHEGKFLRKTL